jgi:hypothetical protein
MLCSNYDVPVTLILFWGYYIVELLQYSSHLHGDNNQKQDQRQQRKSEHEIVNIYKTNCKEIFF